MCPFLKKNPLQWVPSSAKRCVGVLRLDLDDSVVYSFQAGVTGIVSCVLPLTEVTRDANILSACIETNYAIGVKG